MDFKAYKKFLDENKHEYIVLDYIEKRALSNGYELYKIFFEFN